MVPVDSDRVSRAPPYSGYLQEINYCRLRGYHPLWLNFPVVFLYIKVFLLFASPAINAVSPATPCAKQLQSITYIRFRLFQFRSPLLSESLGYFLFVLLLRCFSSQAFLLWNYVFISGLSGFNLIGFPHSEFHGSRPFSSSPWLIAALHVLLRLSVPRHPSLALSSFT